MKDSHAEAVRWLRQAENDLEFADLAVREGFHAQACFTAQQAAEKALKAIAYYLGERVVLGHSLVELIARLEARVPELQSFRELAGVLDQYYVPTRYPNGLPGGVPFEAYGREQAAVAVGGARRLLEAARSRIGHRQA
jgi:HEPN domain-containing protein